MKVLVVGGGGREHALVWKLKQSPRVRQIACAPGNAGIGGIAWCLHMDADDIEVLAQYAEKTGVDLTVVGPEVPLTKGIVDVFEERGLPIFGPVRAAAEIEGSKVFAKELMRKYHIPTADFAVFEDPDEATRFVRKRGTPLVIKADGLAAGKGVFVCDTPEEALEALDRIMVQRVFGDAGKRVIVEDKLEGEEASILVFTDGETVLPMPASQDHKAIFEGDRGPNTGGMGAYSPAPVISPDLERRIMDEVMIPAVKGMTAEGRTYRGVLYAGLMIRDGEIRVLEFNARFGDPEAQPLLMRLESDLLEPLEAVAARRLKDVKLSWSPKASVCVVMASGGYPGKYRKGQRISGLEHVDGMKDVAVFHAGTEFDERGRYVTSGGRVLGVTSLGETIHTAVERCYDAVKRISWEDCYYRRDIAAKALNRA